MSKRLQIKRTCNKITKKCEKLFLFVPSSWNLEEILPKKTCTIFVLPYFLMWVMRNTWNKKLNLCKHVHWVLLFLETGTHMLKGIIIHSKYFPNSDWLKVDPWFTITSYWWPNLEEFCVYRGNDVKNAASYRLMHR